MMEDFFPPAGDRKWLFIVISSVVLLATWVAVAYVMERRREKKEREQQKLEALLTKFYETVDATERKIDRAILIQIARAVGADIGNDDPDITRDPT